MRAVATLSEHGYDGAAVDRAIVRVLCVVADSKPPTPAP
jgi:hypothetical protein